MDIIVTLGPSSWSDDVLTNLIEEGIHCVRFPFSKETPIEHLQRNLNVKKLAKAAKKTVLTLADFPGAKPRLSNVKPVQVFAEKEYRIAYDKGEHGKVDFEVDPSLSESSFENADWATIGDGENRFIIQVKLDGVIIGRFEHSATIERKRAFFPCGKNFKVAAFTEKDREFSKFAFEGGFDWIALSFVDSAKTIKLARAYLKETFDWSPFLVAKLETLGGLEKADEIALEADAIMIARGDLAVQIGLENLWQAQKRIIEICREKNIYVINATGFLESMANAASPTRAECIDVFASLKMGTNAIMLSAETTIGSHPVKVVKFLKKLCSTFLEKEKY